MVLERFGVARDRGISQKLSLHVGFRVSHHHEPSILRTWDLAETKPLRRL
jgi:hypothetical protein